MSSEISSTASTDHLIVPRYSIWPWLRVGLTIILLTIVLVLRYERDSVRQHAREDRMRVASAMREYDAAMVATPAGAMTRPPIDDHELLLTCLRGARAPELARGVEIREACAQVLARSAVSGLPSSYRAQLDSWLNAEAAAESEPTRAHRVARDHVSRGGCTGRVKGGQTGRVIERSAA